MLKSPIGIIGFIMPCADPERRAELFVKTRWNGSVICPHCDSCLIKKNGKYEIYLHRYCCRYCRRAFNDKTGTVFHYSRVPFSGWFLHICLYCMVPVACVSIREISKKLGLAYVTAYRMARCIMGRLSDVQAGTALEDIFEVDGLYTHAGMKGRGHHDRILASGRRPSRRGLKHGRGRGGFNRDFPMAMCYHQRGGNTVYGVPQTFSSIADLVNAISRGSTTYTDELSAYDSLDGRGYRHESVCHKDKEYARGGVHVNNCECRAGLLRYRLAKHRGVNKYRLELYAMTFQFLHNRRDQDDFSKFCSVLAVVCA